jgi:DeoR/GlpR family transcriptional regulator of sugar metabolism
MRQMNWFEQRRIEWIAEMLTIYGFINREHLMRKFGISQPQASNDLRTFDARSPGFMVYNLATKRYERKSGS